MNTHTDTVTIAGRTGFSRDSFRTLRAGHVFPLGSSGGLLEVLHGRVWLTRAGDRDDHVVAGGETFWVPPTGQALIEGWDDEQPALVAWHKGTLFERLAARARSAYGRCWEIVDPTRRFGAGSLAAIAALLVGAAVFGPLSDARTQALLAPAVLHNSAGTNASTRSDADARGGKVDAGAGNSRRARVTAQEARRNAAGAA